MKVNIFHRHRCNSGLNKIQSNREAENQLKGGVGAGGGGGEIRCLGHKRFINRQEMFARGLVNRALAGRFFFRQSGRQKKRGYGRAWRASRTINMNAVGSGPLRKKFVQRHERRLRRADGDSNFGRG